MIRIVSSRFNTGKQGRSRTAKILLTNFETLVDGLLVSMLKLQWVELFRYANIFLTASHLSIQFGNPSLHENETLLVAS